MGSPFSAHFLAKTDVYGFLCLFRQFSFLLRFSFFFANQAKEKLYFLSVFCASFLSSPIFCATKHRVRDKQYNLDFNQKSHKINTEKLN